MALDHTQDLSGTDTYRLTTLYPAPDFVKKANHDSLHGDPEKLTANAYADQLNRLYPTHTSAATWLSTAFFMDKRAQLDPARAAVIEMRLNNAAQFHGIKGATDALKQKMASDVVDGLTKLSDSDFALIWRTGEEKERHLPLRNGAEVKVAAAWFGKYRDEFKFDDRQQIATNILAKADQFSVPLDEREMLAKTAGFGHCAASEIVEMLNTRASLARQSHPVESAALTKTAELVAANPPDARDVSFRCKLAASLDQYDRLTKLTRLYDNGGLDRAEDVLFKITEKTARDFLDSHVQTTAGTVYEKQAFTDLQLDHVRDWMGEDFADEVSAGGMFVDAEKTATLVATLPRGDAEMFERMASAAGIHPFARDKASADQGLSREELFALAEQHNNLAPLETAGAFTDGIASVLD